MWCLYRKINALLQKKELRRFSFCSSHRCRVFSAQFKSFSRLCHELISSKYEIFSLCAIVYNEDDK